MCAADRAAGEMDIDATSAFDNMLFALDHLRDCGTGLRNATGRVQRLMDQDFLAEYQANHASVDVNKFTGE